MLNFAARQLLYKIDSPKVSLLLSLMQHIKKRRLSDFNQIMNFIFSSRTVFFYVPFKMLRYTSIRKTCHSLPATFK